MLKILCVRTQSCTNDQLLLGSVSFRLCFGNQQQILGTQTSSHKELGLTLSNMAKGDLWKFSSISMPDTNTDIEQAGERTDPFHLQYPKCPVTTVTWLQISNRKWMDSCSLYDVVQEKQRSWLLLTRLVLEVEMEVSMRVFGNPMPRSRWSRKFKFPSSSQNIIWNVPSNQLTNIPEMKTALTLLCIPDSLNKQCAAHRPGSIHQCAAGVFLSTKQQKCYGRGSQSGGRRAIARGVWMKNVWTLLA